MHLKKCVASALLKMWLQSIAKLDPQFFKHLHRVKKELDMP